MTTVDIPISDFDYESLLDGFDTSSNKNISPTAENDTDSRISDTPPMINRFNNQFDTWSWNMESPLSDDPNVEHYDLNSLISDEKHFMLPEVLTDSDSSTLDELLASFELPEQNSLDASHQAPPLLHLSTPHPYPSPPPSANIVSSSPPLSSQRPIILPKPLTNSNSSSNNFSQPQITSCVKLQSFAGTPSNVPKCVKIEPIINTTLPQQTSANITIITTSKPITVTKLPVIKMPLTNASTSTGKALSPITFVKTEADSITPANIKRITTVYPSTNLRQTDNTSLSTGTFFKALNGCNPTVSPPTKRRRSESSGNQSQLPTQASEISTLTLDQLKVQYGNVSEEALKKHLRMIKNRESASLSRKRRKQLMENLEVKVKELSDENEQLKSENTKLLARIHTLEMENELLKTYKLGNGLPSPRARKPLILMAIALLVVFNIFTLKSLSPTSADLSSSMDLYDSNAVFGSEATLVRGRTILNARRGSSDDSYMAGSESYDGAGGVGNNHFNSSLIPTISYWQCLAYLNKTHSQRINRELHSWVQDHYHKHQANDNSQPVTISDSKSMTIPNNPDVPESIDSIDSSHQHMSRKVALLNRRPTKIATTAGRGQLQPYKGYEPNYDDFIHNIDRRNDTLYFVSFKRDHLILPATVTNQTQRPKMSLILPASITHFNKSIHVPPNHIPMIQIDCEVEDTKLVFVKRGHIPSLYRQDLFRYYSSVPQTTV